MGLAMIVMGVSVEMARGDAPPTQVVYRYIPRTFEEEQENPLLPSDVFAPMFA
jgi:hypothetical protein